MTSAQIRRVASKVRRWVEKYAADDEGYPGYSRFPDDLCGACAIAAGELWKAFNELGVPVTIGVAADSWHDYHCFAIVDGKYIVDVTATQFGKPTKVAVVRRDRVDSRDYFWVARREHKTLRGFKQSQTKREWPDDQKAL
jgi:hypothetical protein